MGIDLESYDYFFRVYQKLRNESSVVANDIDITWNSIGLEDYWIGEGFKGLGDRARGADRVHHRMNRLWLGEKRGLGCENNPHCHKDPVWRDIDREYVVKEIDWYPWFTSMMQEKTGLKQSFMEVPWKGVYGNDGY